jgi:hypothetical protein
LLGYSGTLLGRGATRTSSRSDRCALSVTAINPHFPIVNFTIATVRLASVASLTKQLNIGSIVASSTGKRNNMIVFQLQRTATTPTGATIAGKYDLFRGLGNGPTLRKATEAE